MSLVQPVYFTVRSARLQCDIRQELLCSGTLHWAKSIHSETKTNIWQWIYHIWPCANSSVTFLMISQGHSSSSRRPQLLHHYQTVQHSCCCAYCAPHSTATLIPCICNRQKQVANFMFCHLMSLKGSLVTINKGLSGPQIQSTHSGENFQARPRAQS